MHSLFEPGTYRGWDELAKYLSGLLRWPLTASALETLHRRYGLPAQGGAVRGRPVWFSPRDVAAWVLYLTGETLEERLEILGDGSGRPPPAPRARHTYLDRARGPELPRPLFVALEMTREGGEQPLREPSGRSYAALGEAPLEAWEVERRSPFPVSYWRFDRVRLARPGDLVMPACAKRRRRRREATMLLGAVSLADRHRLLRVPGPWFGLPGGVSTRFLVGNRLPEFEALVRRLRESCPSATLLVWTRRMEVEPVTFDPLPQPGYERVRMDALKAFPEMDDDS